MCLNLLITKEVYSIIAFYKTFNNISTCILIQTGGVPSINRNIGTNDSLKLFTKSQL